MIEIGNLGIVHILVMLFFPIFAVASYFIFRKKNIKSKEIFIWVLLILNFVITWATFTIDIVTKEHSRVNFLNSLPLQMCSINVILYPLFFGLRKKKSAQVFYPYMFFVGTLGALLGLIMPPGDVVGAGVNLLQYNILVYWIKHGLVFIVPIIMIALGFYRPRFNDVTIAMVFLLALVTVMHGVNLLFTYLNGLMGGTAVVNFFYTRIANNFVLKKFFLLSGSRELLYMFPLVLIIYPIFLIEYVLAALVPKIFKKRTDQTKQSNQKTVVSSGSITLNLVLNIMFSVGLAVLIVSNIPIPVATVLIVLEVVLFVIGPLGVSMLLSGNKSSSREDLKFYSVLMAIFGGVHGIVNSIRVFKNQDVLLYEISRN